MVIYVETCGCWETRGQTNRETSDAWPRQVRKSMPMHMAACRHMLKHRCPLLVLGHVSPGKSETWRRTNITYMLKHIAMCRHMHWHTFPITLLGHMAQTSKGQVCQCGCRQPHALAYFSYFSWGTLPRTGSPAHWHTFFPYVSGPHGQDK